MLYSSMRVRAMGLGLSGLTVFLASGCGSKALETRTDNQRGAATAAADMSPSADGTGVNVPRLAEDSTDQVLSTLVIPFNKGGLQLTSATTAATGSTSWVVDMQDSLPVVGGVAPDKYLKVTGSLTVPTAAANQDYDIGCIYVDMKDNVYYRENTWLRLATDGIKGEAYTDIVLPMSVDIGTWQNVPTLNNSVTIQQFASNTIKSFTGTLCFKLDFSNAPADQYAGNIIVQYLRPGTTANPPACSATSTAAACAPSTGSGSGSTGGSGSGTAVAGGSGTASAAFACSSTPQVLKAGQTTVLSWANVPTGDTLQYVLSSGSGSYSGKLGTVTSTSASTATYTAPATVPTDAQIVVTARPVGSELLPSFCQVALAADGQIGVPDNGVLQGLPGNVYQLPVNTAALPDFSKLTPVMQVVAGNLDVANEYFTAGFPGIPNLVEWFGIQFRGQIIIPTNETCSFKLTADDGAILYIDKNVVVNNDGLHAVTDKFGSATLTQGAHAFEVDYYQGPRWYIALQLAWQCGNATEYTIVPPSAFTRPLQ